MKSGTILSQYESRFIKSDLPNFRAGDTVKVHQLVVDGNKERIQIFEGLVLRRRGGSIHETFTVRKVSNGVGVEKNFFIHSPRISKIEVKQYGRVRRGRIYYIRQLTGKASRIRAAQNIRNAD